MVRLTVQRLCDNDPGVMGATLCPLYDLTLEEPNSYKDLVVSFVNILKQVAERRLPTSYDYHQMPAPFIQVHDLLFDLLCVDRFPLHFMFFLVVLSLKLVPFYSP